ncbi:hypothetical protein DI005_20015 [Prauserella sp. PE36]|uniref:hypothetical protein n=1 Tax=Prauserella sp. PE36 TaxID=1504709 RepID=UPI000DE22CBA|nr:hypothetical protein [Prauserella sp. PE36]RBM18082.1 hypothetical protein DI005_20015 [Prauserella sp. PE36]
MVWDWLLWPSAGLFLFLRSKLQKSQKLSKFKWMWVPEYALLVLGVWALLNAPLPFLPSGWDSLAGIGASLFGLIAGWVISWFGGAPSGAAIVAGVFLFAIVVAAALDLLDGVPEKLAKTFVYAAPVLVLATGGWIAQSIGGAINWVALAGPNIVMALVQ